MAELSSFGIVRHVRGEPTSHVVHVKNGEVKRAGRGLSFWFFPLGTSLVEVPLDDRDVPFLFHGRSRDFQEVVVQGVITYRVLAPELVSQRLSFALDTRTGAYLDQPLEQLAGVLTQLVQELATSWLAEQPLGLILDEGLARLRADVQEGLLRDGGLAAMGIEIVSTRVTQVAPTAEMERALQMPTRESIQQRADEATFQRRALAVEKERAIAENEIASQLELARREEKLIEQKGHNDRRRAEEQARAKRVAAEARAEEVRLSAAAQAEATTLTEQAHVDAERARMEIYRSLPSEALLGLAARELAGKLQSIEHLTVGSDLLGPLLQRLASAGTKRLEGES